LSGTIVITCVSDEKDFTKSVHDYLSAELVKQVQLKTKDRGVTLLPIRLLVDSNEIHVDTTNRAEIGMIKSILKSYLNSNPSRLKDYKVIEFGDALTIGRQLPLLQMEMQTCEICGFFTPYAEEIQTHRMTHFGI
jgi:hypothetical protein